jgi:pyrroloquinoline quinone biosynthesis protein D
MINLDTILSPSSGVIGRIVDGEAVLVLPEHGKVKVLNKVGGRIWELVDGARTVGEIVLLICQEFEVDEARAREDTLTFVSDLLDRSICYPIAE